GRQLNRLRAADASAPKATSVEPARPKIRLFPQWGVKVRLIARHAPAEPGSETVERMSWAILVPPLKSQRPRWRRNAPAVVALTPPRAVTSSRLPLRGCSSVG